MLKKEANGGYSWQPYIPKGSKKLLQQSRYFISKLVSQNIVLILSRRYCGLPIISMKRVSFETERITIEMEGVTYALESFPIERVGGDSETHACIIVNTM